MTRTRNPDTPPLPPVRVRHLGLQPYEPVWHQMQAFTNIRTPETPDEIWALEHQPVFTLGQAGKQEHVIAPGNIPVIQVDRGGQVTYHGPGQLVIYLLLDLRRLKTGIRPLVTMMEESIVDLLADYDIQGCARTDAPGVYVAGKKIASLGLRVRRGCSFHGLSLNVDMDLEPFRRINPCGYPGLEVTQLCELNSAATPEKVTPPLLCQLKERLGYNSATDEPETHPS
ncbi:MAG: lipoyl(octanoyl) transferase LipB [Gammaproteobacteria bacterium]|nr:lipoyl(octanoyl) transferase LipB [Gammaproteobacteria bacterium]